MSANAYEILALAMRYVFAFLMLLIVLRAWRITSIDSRRARRLRRLSPQTGIIGEMLVMDGGERAKPGMRYPLTLEGCIGSARTADIRLRHSSVRRRHAYYLMTDDGLFVRGHASARIRRDHGNLEREVLLRDGETLQLGKVSLLLVLSGADSAPEEIHRTMLRHRRAQARPEENLPDGEDEIDSIFQAGEDADEMFFSNPASCLNPEDFDDFDDPYDEYDDPN